MNVQNTATQEVLRRSNSKNEKLELFRELCANHPSLIRESLLVHKTWMRLGNRVVIPYMEATLDECLEWFHSKV